MAQAGPLADAQLLGKSLVQHAQLALQDAGVELLAADPPWDRLVADEQGSASGTRHGNPSPVLVVHDPCCPLTPPAFIAETVAQAAASNSVVVGVLPVSDTVKSVTGDVVGNTLDRESLWELTSPVVLPGEIVVSLPEWPDTSDLARLVAQLRERFAVRFVQAPSIGRRVVDESDLRLLTALGPREE